MGDNGVFLIDTYIIAHSIGFVNNYFKFLLSTENLSKILS